jgi:hypothetical protein
MAKLGINTGSSPDAGDGDSLLIGALKINSNFDEIYNSIGDGTNLHNSIGYASTAGIATYASVSRVVVKDDGSTVGTAGTIDFGTGLLVSAVSAGVVTVTASGGTSSQWVTTAAGIHTLSNVGIGTTNPTSALTVKGNTSLQTLNVSGISTFNDDVYFIGQTNDAYWSDSLYQGSLKFEDNARIVLGSDIITPPATIYSDGTRAIWNGTLSLFGGLEIGGQTSGINTIARFRIIGGVDDNVELYYGGNKKFETLGAGVTITGTTFTNQLSVSGVSTLSSNVSVGGTISVNGGVTLTTNNATIVGTSATAGEIKRIGGAPFFYDGSAWREFVLSSGTPVTQPADTEWDNVVFRATFDDDYTDAKFGVTPVVISAGSSIVGAAVTIGTGAYRNDGSIGAGLSYAYRSDYDFTGSWTIEFWIYHDTMPGAGQNYSLVSQISSTNNSGDWTFAFGNTFSSIGFYWSNKTSTLEVLNNVTFTDFSNNYLQKWRHYALVREGDNGSIHFYIDGVESSLTINNQIIDNNILHINGAGLLIGAPSGSFSINSDWNSSSSVDAIFDDMRISAGVGTAGQRYNSIGISTFATFTPQTTALPTSGTLTSIVNPPGDKYGEITLGGSPTWRGTSGVTVSQQSSGNYRVSFASTYTNSNDYYVLSQGMDQGFASYVGIARSTTHVDLSINRQSNDAAVDSGSLSVQIKNHI